MIQIYSVVMDSQSFTVHFFVLVFFPHKLNNNKGSRLAQWSKALHLSARGVTTVPGFKSRLNKVQTVNKVKSRGTELLPIFMAVDATGT